MIDLSHPLSVDTPTYPGDPAPRIDVLDSTSYSTPTATRHLNSSYLGVGLHCGTHMDAPYHFFGDRHAIDHVALENCVGPALLIRMQEQEIRREHLLAYQDRMREVRRVVLNTGWHQRWGQADYFADHPVLTGDAAQLLVDCGVVLIGVDTPSVDHYPFPAHLALLGNDVLIVENLTNLDRISSERFNLSAIPLRIVGRDASPVRAIAWE
jgi:Predicted metal-dependent hydrolase